MRILLLVLMMLAPAAAQARWLQASSAHFVIYSDDTPSNIHNFSAQLERFHAAITILLKVPNITPSPSNRVTVYVVRSEGEVRRLKGEDSKFVYAFYVPQAGGSLAIVPPVAADKGEIDFSMIALLHEYAHHVTLSAMGSSLPTWYVEGSAEFLASANFFRDGTVELGLPAQHRVPELYLAREVSVEELLDPALYAKHKSKEYDAFYGKSWLLFHYLVFTPKRSAQFAAYLKDVAEGKSSIEAGKAAFGDLHVLEKEMETYLLQPRLNALRLPPERLPISEIAVRPLTAGEAAMMPVRIRSKRGVNHAEALALLPEAQKIAAAYPGDPAVLAALAEAEHDAGNDDAAIAAADAALALDPALVDAYVQKGYSLFRKASQATDKKAAYALARKPFIALNKLENDHPLPLEYFFLSQVEQGLPPGALGMSALRRAVELAPFDLSLRWMLALQDIRDRQTDEAVANLRQIAFNPHAEKNASEAQKLLDRIQAGASAEQLNNEGLLPKIDESQAH